MEIKFNKLNQFNQVSESKLFEMKCKHVKKQSHALKQQLDRDSEMNHRQV